MPHARKVLRSIVSTMLAALLLVRGVGASATVLDRVDYVNNGAEQLEFTDRGVLPLRRYANRLTWSDPERRAIWQARRGSTFHGRSRSR